jgi:Domain of unknown function (DUF4326)
MPKRIQRKRTKGWRMPPNTVYVGRPTKWGNPFRLEADTIMVDASHRRKILYPWVPYDWPGSVDDVVRLFRDLLMNPSTHKHADIEPEIRDRFRWMRDHIFDLRGKDLACWCKEDHLCHADALLELANPEIDFHPEYIGTEVAPGFIAHIKPDTSPETIEALQKMAEAIEKQIGDAP